MNQLVLRIQENVECFIRILPMSKMNSYKATQANRYLPDKDKTCIPIIAMTANAFAEDVQAALNAGMDDHVAKPVDMEIITSVITKYVER